MNITIHAIAIPLSELKQKPDSLCSPKLVLLMFAIADPFSGLANVADSFCFPICDRHSDNLNELNRRIASV